jgi:DNA-binding transcriptional MerR regulator
MEEFTKSELCKRAKIPVKTFDGYIRTKVILPVRTDGNGVRYYSAATVRQLRLLRTLKKEPFRYRLEEIGRVLAQFPIGVLEHHLKDSGIALRNFIESHGQSREEAEP